MESEVVQVCWFEWNLAWHLHPSASSHPEQQLPFGPSRRRRGSSGGQQRATTTWLPFLPASAERTVTFWRPTRTCADGETK